MISPYTRKLRVNLTVNCYRRTLIIFVIGKKVATTVQLNASKCETFLISNKCKTISCDYFINHSPLSWRASVKYLGVWLQSNLSWSDHCKYVSAKASKCLNFLRHPLWGATCEAKSIAYKSLVRPILEYACTAWSPHTAADKSTLERVQRRAA